MIVKNLLERIPSDLPKELTEILKESSGVRIERIVSRGHASPHDFWYDQDESEWVLLLSGRARIQFADDSKTTDLTPGDSIEIPARVRHRVDWTDPTRDTVWLAIFFREESQP